MSVKSDSKAKPILGQSASVKEMLGLIGKVASTKTNVLIIGESGTGKELVARMIHDSGPLKDKPFVPINCGAIPENLIESEMFGHRRGSFTGAVGDKPGLFETANGGSLFLDEVGELPLSLQVKLLRAIQERVFRKVGGNEDIRVDVRIIAATNRDLEAAVAKGTFREDLYYRLNVILIHTPPLRERKGDVKLLVDYFLTKFAAKLKKPIQSVSPAAMAAFERYGWPGNVRELENVIERAVTLESGEEISAESLPPSIAELAAGSGSLGGGFGSSEAGEVGGAGPGHTGATITAAGGTSPVSQAGEIRLPMPDFSRGVIQLDEILSQVERAYLDHALAYSKGVKKKAADLLGITFRSIRYRLKKQGIDDGPEG